MNEAVATDPYQAPVSDLSLAPTDDLFAAYVGPKNADYYLQRFDRFRAGGSKQSWHWPAFFVTAIWLLYRKMWLLALVYIIGMPLLLGLAAGILAVAGAPDMVFNIINVLYYFAIFIIVPAFANFAYYRHAQVKVDKVSAAFPGTDERAAELARIGGTSRVWIILLLAGTVVAGILAAIAIPAYQDYTIRAQVSEGLTLSSGARAAVSEAWEQDGVLPADNFAAGLPDGAELYGTYVESVRVSDGAVNVFYGGEAHELIHGAVLVLEPALTNDALSWSCSSDSIEARHLPAACRQ